MVVSYRHRNVLSQRVRAEGGGETVANREMCRMERGTGLPRATGALK